MHFFFLAAAFFAFHLLFAYLADHVPIHAAFAIAAVTSLALVMSYLRLVFGSRFAFFAAGTAQLVYLVLFSYAFFFKGLTGLAHHDRRGRDAVRADAGDGEDTMERDIRRARSELPSLVNRPHCPDTRKHEDGRPDDTQVRLSLGFRAWLRSWRSCSGTWLAASDRSRCARRDVRAENSRDSAWGHCRCAHGKCRVGRATGRAFSRRRARQRTCARSRCASPSRWSRSAIRGSPIPSR